MARESAQTLGSLTEEKQLKILPFLACKLDYEEDAGEMLEEVQLSKMCFSQRKYERKREEEEIK